MSISHDEKVMSIALRDKRVPMSTVEGEFHGERAIFLCLTDKDEKTGKVDFTPVAMLLREQDIKHISRNPDDQPQRVVLTGHQDSEDEDGGG